MAWAAADIREGMTFLALYSGNAVVAARAAREATGKTFKPADLRKWRTGEYADLYDELRDASGEMAEALIRDTLETAKMAAATERLAIERTHHQLENDECKDPARAARDLSHIKAVNVEKFLTLTGRPTEIVRHESPDEVIRGLISDHVFQPVKPGELPPGDDVMVFDLPEEAVVELREALTQEG